MNDIDAAENGYTDKTFTNLPTLAIVGRSNTGKSTLFNRFLGKRLAIVDPSRAVTRDANSATCFIKGHPIKIIDTGGYILNGNSLDKCVTQKAFSAIKSADVVLLLLDSTQNTREDESLIELLRPYTKKLIAAVNKCEGGKNESAAYNYARYGLGELFFVSASHGDNISVLATAIVNKMDFSKVKEVNQSIDTIRVAIIGKPNTGKSTLLNTLTGKDLSIVSDIAGTTRDSVDGTFCYKGKSFIITDTAGIRKKSKVTEDVEYYSVNRAIKELDNCDIAILMIDSETGLTEQDKKICNLAYENGRGIIFALNKWDKACDESDLNGTRPLNQTRAFKKAKENINIMFAQMAYAPIIPLVAKSGQGVKTLLSEIIEIWEELNKKFSTNVLNRALKDFIATHSTPTNNAHHFSARYITQTSTNPVEFTIFVTKTQNVQDSYITYLQNKFRKELGLEKIPIKITLKASRKAWEEREK